MSELITDIRTREAWQQALETFSSFDFYHTYDFHVLSSKQDQSEPVLFYFHKADLHIGWPLLIRSIEGSDKKDAIGVYGYSGLLFNRDASDEELELFSKSIQEHFASLSIVSAFARLHPCIDDHQLISSVGEVIKLASTVWIDLKQNPEEQFASYRKKCRYEIRKMRKLGYEVIHDRDFTHLSVFSDIYLGRMSALNAEHSYFFQLDYMNEFVSSKEYETELYLCRQDGEFYAGALFTFCGPYAQYHLSGSLPNPDNVSPTRLLIDYARERAFEKGCELLHLGGGVGSQEDALFLFKAGFSKERAQFNICKAIFDQDAYQALSEKYDKMLEETDSVCTNAGFFPYYRRPFKKSSEISNET